MRALAADATIRPARLPELRKLAAFGRRDLLVTLSYRTLLVSDWVMLAVQVGIFAFVGRMVDPSALPTFGGRTISYLEFVTVGIAVGAVLQLGLNRTSEAIRREQATGTLEYLLTTPTSLRALQIGSVVFDAIYVPLRTVLFLLLCALLLDVRFAAADIAPATVVLLALVPVVWGLGVAAAGAVLTFRRGASGVGLAGTLLAISSGAYFPVELFPTWIRDLVVANPVAITLEAMRSILIGGGGAAVALDAVVRLLPMGVVAVVAGSLVFRWALRREVRRGTISLY